MGNGDSEAREEVPDGDWLLMGIFPGQWYPAEDRPMTGEFKVRTTDSPPEAGLSMYRASLVETNQVLTVAQEAEGYGLVRLRALDFRELGLFVVSAPDDDDPVIGHAHVEV